jgi:hypothetical protein
VVRFSAVGYFFGRELHRSLGVPVGIVHSSLGATDIAAWTSEEAQTVDADLSAAMSRWAADEASYDDPAAQKRYQQQLGEWTIAEEKAKADGKVAPGKPRVPIAPRENPNRPGNLFNGMIAPLISYRFRGAIWYQGEQNCSSVKAADLYRRQLPLLIADWRRRAGNDFWFAWAQLPNFQNRGFWPLVREGMLESLRVEKTGMAVTIDVGDSDDLHPKNKQEVGRRLAQWALGSAYHRPVATVSGPIVTRWAQSDREFVVHFSHANKGLVARGGDLKGFLIAGDDHVWLPAKGRIAGDSVVLSHAAIAKPVAVRYAFEGNPTISLYNGAGLPASPFRTDRWPIP